MIALRSSRKEHAVSTPNNYAPPQSVVADISSSDVPFEKATRLSRLGAVILDGLIFSCPLMPTLLLRRSARMVHARRNSAAISASWQAAMARSGISSATSACADRSGAARDHRPCSSIATPRPSARSSWASRSRARTARALLWPAYSGCATCVNGLVASCSPSCRSSAAFYLLIDSCMIFGEQRRCCHDYIADTIVIRA